jgi:hypothetical protein
VLSAFSARPDVDYDANLEVVLVSEPVTAEHPKGRGFDDVGIIPVNSKRPSSLYWTTVTLWKSPRLPRKYVSWLNNLVDRKNDTQNLKSLVFKGAFFVILVYILVFIYNSGIINLLRTPPVRSGTSKKIPPQQQNPTNYESSPSVQIYQEEAPQK